MPIARQFTALLGIAMFCALTSSQYSDHLGALTGLTQRLLANDGVTLTIAVQFGGVVACYMGMRQSHRLASQRLWALGMVIFAVTIVPFSLLGGQVLMYVTVALLALATPVWTGWLMLLVCYGAINILTNANWLSMAGDVVGSFQSRQVTLYMLLIGAMLLLYTQQTKRLEEQNRQLERDVATIESLMLAEERARMASDMHDSIGQRLAAIHYAHEAASHALAEAKDLDTAKAAVGYVDEAERITRDATSEVRQLARALNPYDFGGQLDARTVEALADSFASSGVMVTPHIEGDLNQVGDDAKLLAYRMLQESLTNAVRHAHAARIELTIRTYDGHLIIRVEDDGPGIVDSDLAHGFGLRRLKGRAERIGGMLTVGSSPTLDGAMVTLDLPFDEGKSTTTKRSVTGRSGR